jgi:hypothetical protein
MNGLSEESYRSKSAAEDGTDYKNYFLSRQFINGLTICFVVILG